MLLHDIEALAAAVLPGAGAVHVESATQGLVNETYRVARGGAVYALRMAAERGVGLGMDREWEARVWRAAAAAQLAPALVYADTGRGTLVSRWVDGRALREAEVRSALGVQRMADLLRRIHALTPSEPRRDMQPAARMQCYAGRLAPAAPARIELARRAASRLLQLAAYEVAPVLCHSDLHVLNIVDDGASLVLLDWEYSHFADPFWDVAAWCVNNDFDEAARRGFLESYLGRAAIAVEWSRLGTLLWLFDYVCLLWSELYLRNPHAGAAPAVAVRAAQIAARLDEQLPAH